MTTFEADDIPAVEAAYLIAVGELDDLDADEIHAYETFWYANNVAGPLLHKDAQALRRAGYSLAHTLDATRHKLVDDQTSFAYPNGFSAHQTHLIEHSPRAGNSDTPHDQDEAPRAMDNLLDQDEQDLVEFVESDAPRLYLVNVLLTARSGDEALEYRKRWENGTPEDQVAVEKEVAMLAALRQDLAVIPNCCPTGTPLPAPPLPD